MDLMVLGEQALHMGSVIGPQSRQGQQTSGCDIKLMRNEKRVRRDANTARCKAELKKIAPPATDPFPGTQDGQNLISWRWSLPYLQTQFDEHPCTQFRVIVVTDPQTRMHTHTQTDTHTHTNRQDR